MPLVGVFVSGLVGAFNLLVARPLVAKAVFGFLFLYVISVLIKAVTDLLAPYVGVPDFFALFTGYEWLWDYFHAYRWLNWILPAVAVRFIIRRLPFVG
jgi:hypothetical protein